MKSKSIVQERLDASKNRLEIIKREVESVRMSPGDVAKGLRHIGTVLESVQKFVRTDSDMKFQSNIDAKLEAGMGRLSTTITHLEDSGGITGDALNESLTQVGRIFDSLQELVDLEIETLS
jgi:hypothetical protein